MKMHAPFKLEMKVKVVTDDNEADVTYVLPQGRFPTREDIEKGLKLSLENVRQQMPEHDWRLASKSEFFNSLVADTLGAQSEKVATPGGPNWDNPEDKLALAEELIQKLRKHEDTSSVTGLASELLDEWFRRWEEK